MRIVPIVFFLALRLSAADLFTAIRNGDVNAVKVLLRAGGDKESPNADGLTPLMYSVMTAGTPVMRVLLDAGANSNAATTDGVTALHIAAYDLEKTRLLLSRGAAANAATKAGETPLLVAADHAGALPVVSLLLSKGAAANAKISGGAFSGVTTLERAARNADLPLMRLLIANGARIADAPNLPRFAAFGHCRECLRLALDGGASPNSASNRARSALQDAAAYGDLEMVRMLVEKAPP